MKPSEYRQALKTAQRDLLALFRERETLERQIAQTRQTVQTLMQMVYGDAKSNTQAYIPSTLTDACQWILMASTRPLDAPSVRDRVESYGFDIRSSNPLASVHSVLKRLIEQGQLHVVYLKDRTHPRGGYRLYSRSYWWGEYTKLPEGWVIPKPGAIEKQLQESGREIDENQKARLEKAGKTLKKKYLK